MKQNQYSICLPTHQIQNSKKSQKKSSNSHPYTRQEKLEKPRKVNISKSAITLKRTLKPTLLPGCHNQKTITWDIKEGEKLTKNAKEAVQDASIRGNLQPIWGKTFKAYPFSLRWKSTRGTIEQGRRWRRHTIFLLLLSHMYLYRKGVQGRTNGVILD